MFSSVSGWCHGKCSAHLNFAQWAFEFCCPKEGLRPSYSYIMNKRQLGQRKMCVSGPSVEWDKKDKMVAEGGVDFPSNRQQPSNVSGLSCVIGHEAIEILFFPPGFLSWLQCSPDLNWKMERITNPCHQLAGSLVEWKALIDTVWGNPLIAASALLMKDSAAHGGMSSVVLFPFLCAYIPMHKNDLPIGMQCRLLFTLQLVELLCGTNEAHMVKIKWISH